MLVINKGLSEREIIVKRGQLMLAPGMKVMEMPDIELNTFNEILEKIKKIAEKTQPLGRNGKHITAFY
jgi:hypothetical protein